MKPGAAQTVSARPPAFGCCLRGPRRLGVVCEGVGCVAVVGCGWGFRSVAPVMIEMVS